MRYAAYTVAAMPAPSIRYCSTSIVAVFSSAVLPFHVPPSQSTTERGTARPSPSRWKRLCAMCAARSSGMSA